LDTSESKQVLSYLQVVKQQAGSALLTVAAAAAYTRMRMRTRA
jgi:hypothetical protein